MYYYRDNKVYREAQLKRQSVNIVCACGAVLLYSSLSPHKKSMKHFRMLLKVENPEEFNRLEQLQKDMRKSKHNKKKFIKVLKNEIDKIEKMEKVEKVDNEITMGVKVKIKKIKELDHSLKLEVPIN